MRNKSTSETNCPGADGTLFDQVIKTLQEQTEIQQKSNNDETMHGSFLQWVTKPENTKEDENKKTKDKQEKPTKRLNFLKRRPDTEKPPASDELRVLNERLSRLESNPLLQNVHLSRPSTPKPVPSTSKPESSSEPAFDKYRVMYLLVRVEQQLEHTRKVVKKMQESGAKRSRVRSVSKVMRQLESQHKQLLRILTKDTSILAEIGDVDDMELFFQNIDCICEATQEITYEEDDNEALSKSLLSNKDNADVIVMKDGKVKLKNSGQSCENLRSVFGVASSEQDDETFARRKSTKDFLEKYRKKSSKGDLYKSSGKGDKNKLMYKSEALGSWSDTDTDEEMSVLENGEGQRYKWPLLNTKDEKRIEKEKKLHTLMTEIDDLMLDVGLTDSKSHTDGITYEIVMMGSGEMTKQDTEKKEAPKKKYRQFETNPERFKGAKSKIPSTCRDGKSVRKSKSQSDQFVEEFDKLLNECDSKK